MTRRWEWNPGFWWGLGFYLAAWAWFLPAIVGFVFVTTPETGRHSHLIGWTCLLIALGVLLGTMDRWVRYAQVFLGGGVLGGWVAFTRGHLLSSQDPFPRPLALAMTLVFVGCSLLIGMLARRPLQPIDRVGLTAFVTAFTSGFLVKGSAGLAGPTVGFAVLLALWVYHRYTDEKPRRRRDARRRRAAPLAQSADDVEG